MIHKLNLENLLFLDIETVPETKYYSDLSEDKQKLWDSKSKYQRKEDYSPEDFYDRAGIWAEFGKIICISVGYFSIQGDINIAEPKALIGFAGPRVIEQTVRETLPEGFQKSEFLLEHGAIDMIVNRHQMRATVCRILSAMTHQPAPVAEA